MPTQMLAHMHQRAHAYKCAFKHKDELLSTDTHLHRAHNRRTLYLHQRHHSTGKTRNNPRPMLLTQPHDYCIDSLAIQRDAADEVWMVDLDEG